MAASTFPFPIPEPPSSPETTRVDFPFPPPAGAWAPTVRTRLAAPFEAPSEEREPLFRVPAWIPVPVEGAAYFILGSLIGVFLMMTVITVMTPLRPQPASSQTSAHVPEQGIRQVVISTPRMATQRAPLAPPVETTQATTRSPIARRR